MTRSVFARAVVLGAALLAAPQTASLQTQTALPPAATRPVDFVRDVQPILEASCTRCHARGKAKGGFSLETRAALLTAPISASRNSSPTWRTSSARR